MVEYYRAGIRRDGGLWQWFTREEGSRVHSTPAGVPKTPVLSREMALRKSCLRQSLIFEAKKTVFPPYLWRTNISSVGRGTQTVPAFTVVSEYV